MSIFSKIINWILNLFEIDNNLMERMCYRCYSNKKEDEKKSKKN